MNADKGACIFKWRTNEMACAKITINKRNFNYGKRGGPETHVQHTGGLKDVN